MIIRRLVPAQMPEGSDPTINDPPTLEPEASSATAFGVQLDLGKEGVVLTITQKRDPDGAWAFFVTSSAEPGQVDRYGPEGSTMVGDPR